MSDVDLDHIEALAAAATPGPWEAHHRENLDWLSESDLVESSDHQPGSKVVFSVEDQERWFSSCWPHRNASADAAFIAAVDPATIRRLVARVREAQAEVERLRGLFSATYAGLRERAEAAEARVAAEYEGSA